MREQITDEQLAIDLGAFDADQEGVLLYRISRKAALAKGMTLYFTGRPCPRGHVSPRIVKGWACLACHRERLAKLREDPIAKAHHNRLRHESAVRNSEKVRENSRKHYHSHRELLTEKNRAYRLANKDKVRAGWKLWAAKNPGAVARYKKAKGALRRARLRGAGGSYSAADIQHILSRQKGQCAEPTCRVELGDVYHVDHIVPLARGGSNWPKNLQCLCRKCNIEKWAKDPIQWAQEKGRLL